VDLYSALDDKHLVLTAFRHGSHIPAFSFHSHSPDAAAMDCGDNI